MLSIWEKETFCPRQDVIIVGSGFAGLWSAYYLKKQNKKLKIIVVDRGIFPLGASTRNAGFTCFGSLTELLADEQKMGTDKMLQLVEMRFKGLQQIEKLFTNKIIDYNTYGGYELFMENDELLTQDLKVQTVYLNTLLKKIVNKKKIFNLVDDKINSFGFGQVAHLVKNEMEGQLHPGKLIQALVKKVQRMGVRVLLGIEVENFENQNNQILIHSNQQINLSTKQLLICTNAFSQKLIPELYSEPGRGQVLVTSEIENLKWKGTFHYDEGFYYFRNVGKRVLLGGARNKAFDEERTDSTETSEIIQQELERFLREIILPADKEPYTIDYRWSGIMGMGKDKIPDVKEIKPNVFCAINLGGMGLALAPLIGKEVSGMMCG